MSFFSSLSPKCPSCGTGVKSDAHFCPKCGTPLAGGTRKCGSCGTDNRGDAKFCKNCGQPLSATAAPDIQRHRWTRAEPEFAVRVETDDLPGLLKRGIKVEPGTNAMFIEQGMNRGTIPPGEYTLGTLGERVRDWFSGSIPERVTILLVDVTPTEFIFNLGGRFTKDEYPIGMSVRMETEVNEPGKFLVNLLKGRERLAKEDLRQYLYPEVIQVANTWLASNTLDQLAQDIRLRSQFELDLEENLKRTFAQSGLKFLQVRTVELNLEPYDHLKGVRAKYALMGAESEADLAGRRRVAATEDERRRFEQDEKFRLDREEVDAKERWADLTQRVNLQEIKELEQKVGSDITKAELYQRARQSILDDKISQERMAADFDRVMDDLGFDKEKYTHEREELRKAWREGGDDHDKARAHLLAKLEVENAYELRAIELKQRTDLNRQELDAELEMERRRATRQQEIEVEKFEFELKRRRAELQYQQEVAEAARKQAELDAKAKQAMATAGYDEELRQMNAELELGLKGLRGMKEIRSEEETRKWDLEKQRLDFEWAKQQHQMEIELQRERIQKDHELNRLDKLGTLGTEALISASGAEQARILADLKRTEALKGMTEEQILAMAAKDSPEVARALQEKFRAIAEGQASKEVAEMYERMLADKDVSERKAREDADKRVQEVGEAWDKSSERTKELTERALDRMADTAQAFAKGSGSTPVIIMPGQGGPQVVASDGRVTGSQQEKEEGTKTCPKCSKAVSLNAKFCEHCQYEFPG